MAWIEVHQDLRWHWKVERMAQDLKIEKAHALGLAVSLWLWAISNARDGDVSRFTDREICAACGWNGADEAHFVAHLRRHELIDKNGVIHDWKKHGIRLLEDARKRVRNFRRNVKRNVTGNVTGNVFLRKKEREKVSKKESSKKEGVQGEKSLSTLSTEQPHQIIINRFLELQGTPRTALTAEQVTGTYRRHSRSALALINESGGLDNAIAALEWGAAYFDRKSLTWTLDTIAKHLPTFAKYGRDDTLAAKHGLNRNQVNQFRKLASWLESKTEPSGNGEIISTAHAGVSDHPS